MSGRIELDISRFPIVVTRFVGDPELQAVEDYFVQIREVLNRRERFVPISLLDEINHVGNSRLKTSTEIFNRTHVDDIKQYTAGMVWVASSAVIRASLRAYVLLSPPPVGKPVIVANLDDAFIAAEKLLR